ncbi:winged helix-turn-helix domain-containing protein [Sphingomonas cannabina]|uniref:winged helix-turn-helix domain-containing protein n=1 Tax=Sphingomonas cannabina TaxID=2899123 RepID=UPI001F227EA8|nr:winged helix-turn-helix domain-containing protein [Sphingomonas cannabina]UIJ46920.1 winged helix-turn-helix domain-containing protein [Sphingomonas cannabina]
MFANQTNLDKAHAAWGADLPEWVKILAEACDRTNQREVADRLGKSGGYVSRIIRRDYAGSYDEAETLVRARLGAEVVACPLWGEIPLSSCLKLRRRKAPPQNHMHHACARTCPDCPNNTDRNDRASGEED